MPAARGLQIPDDVVLVGFDDIERTALASVPITSVKQTVESLLKRIRGQSVEPYITLQPELVVRATSLKPGAGDVRHQNSLSAPILKPSPLLPHSHSQWQLESKTKRCKRCSPP